MNLLTKIESAHFVATDAQVESLAAEAYTANAEVSHATGVYLRVLVAACQAELGPPRRGRAPGAEAQLSVVENIHKRYYAAVLRGVTTDDISASETVIDPKERQRRALERNRRSSFARSSKSTLATWTKAGGDIRALSVGEVTKASLRPPDGPDDDKEAAAVDRSRKLLLRALGLQAEVYPDEARVAVQTVMDELQKVLDDLGEPPEKSAARESAHARTRVGTIVIPKGRSTPARRLNA